MDCTGKVEARSTNPIRTDFEVAIMGDLLCFAGMSPYAKEYGSLPVKRICIPR
jgi:hypothetical protein